MGITGCGDYLSESLELMKELTKEHDLDVKVYLSQAERCGKMVQTFKDLKTSSPRLH